MPVLLRPTNGMCDSCDTNGKVTEIRTAPRPEMVALCSVCLSALKTQLGVSTIDPDEIGGGKVGRKHPDTARRAAATVRKGSQQAALLTALVAKGDHGMTNAEAADSMTLTVGHPISRNQAATRMLELRERGLAAAAEKPDGAPRTRWTGSGSNSGQVWIATPNGRAVRESLERRYESRQRGMESETR